MLETIAAANKVKGGSKKLAASAGGAALAGVLTSISPVINAKPNTVYVRTRLGRIEKQGKLAKLFGREGQSYGLLKGPGLFWNPTHGAKRVIVKDETEELAVKIDAQKKQTRTVKATAYWGIRSDDPYAGRSFTTAESGEKLAENFRGVTKSAMHELFTGMPNTTQIDREKLVEDMKILTNFKLLRWGIELRDFQLDETAKTDAQKVSSAIIKAGKAPESQNSDSNIAAVTAAVRMVLPEVLGQQTEPTETSNQPRDLRAVGE